MITARGVGLAVSGVALVAGGFGFGYPQLAVVGTAASLVALGAVLLVAWRPKLAIDRTAEPDRVPRGGDCQVTLAVRNTGRMRGGRMTALDRCGSHDVPVPLVRLKPGASGVVRYPVPTERRGVLRLGPLRVGRRDSLGLAATETVYGEVSTVWIHPTVHPVRAVPAGVTRSMEGRIDAGSHGNLTFHALREYVIGDDLRHVHWRTSARVGDLMVREHVDTSLPKLVVVLDDRAVAHTADSFEAAAEAAASIVVAAVREGLHIELHLLSGRGTGGSDSHLPMLDLLAEAEPQDDVDAGLAARRLRQHRLGDTLIFLTGAGGGPLLEPVAAVRGLYPSIVVGLLGAQSGAGVLPGMLTIAAATGAEFAANWDGVRSW